MNAPASATVALAIASRLRQTLLRSRLSSAGYAVAVVDPQLPSLPTDGLLIADRATASSLLPAGGLWVEILAEPDHDGPADVLSGFGRYRPVDSAMEAASLHRLAAPHDDRAAALDPQQWSTLAALAERAPERISTMLQGYLGRSSDRLAELDRLLAEGDVGSLGRAAHAWKGAAAGVAASRLADALLRLEPVAGTPVRDSAGLLAAIAARSAAADAALRERMPGPSS